MPISQATKIANPPPLGVGILCELRSVGISSIDFFIANFRTRYVPEKDKKNKRRIIKKMFIIKNY